MRNKAISPFISAALIILIGITGIFFALTTLNPVVDQSKDSAVVNEALQNLQLIDDNIREVASESENSKRTISLMVIEGTYKVDQSINCINFTYSIKSDLNLAGQRDNINITRSGSDLIVFICYTNIQLQGSDHFTKGDNSLVVSHNGINSTTNYPIIYVGK
jgi:hypothetical protein